MRPAASPLQMVNIYQAETAEHEKQAEELLREYLEWYDSEMRSAHGVGLDVESDLARTLTNLGEFLPPDGRLLLAEHGDQLAGCACMKKVEPDIGEIKRTYVRAKHRGRGVGRSLLQGLVEDARGMGYAKVRLDTGPFMWNAQQLYRKIGFREVEPYGVHDVPDEVKDQWVFMEMTLHRSGRGAG